jgi:nitric oxide reductase NorE protein
MRHEKEEPAGESYLAGDALEGVQESKFPAGTEGIWTFIFIDMCIFALIFFVYTLQRIQEYPLYEASHANLNVVLGFINTIVLLTSSYFVARAVQAARDYDVAALSNRLAIALALGLGFCAIKAIEYTEKITSGIGIATNSFYTFYFLITFIHLMHVMAGLLFLVTFRKNRSALLRDRQYLPGLENAALFWHFVDLLWVFIYSLLYLL